MKNKLLVALLIFFILLFIISASMIVSMVVSDEREKDAFEGLAERVEQIKKEETRPTENSDSVEFSYERTDSTDATVSTAPGILPEYAELYELNNDLFGWIRIDGTSINYPVMYTPKDPEFYLRRSFDKTESQSGTPFVDASCYEDGGLYLVYGHHMHNGTMFAELTNYADNKYRNEHPIVHFDTIYERREYEVIAAFYSKVFADNEQGFRYYAYTDLAAPAVFYEYAEQVKASSIYDTGYIADYGDKLLTLSTCDYYTDNGRFVVVAKRIK